jgi:hypothetical protein
MGRIFDVFPFLDELDVTYLRMQELAPVVDWFVIHEPKFTFSGEPRETVFLKNQQRFSEFRGKIRFCEQDDMGPRCVDRISGRLREANQRNKLAESLIDLGIQKDDILTFSDCDEIPSRKAVEQYANSQSMRGAGINRLKQSSYYYNVNCLVDYGHDFASRARIGTWKHVGECGSLYAFRMYRKNEPTCPSIENGGWHFGYFGGIDKIMAKVEAMKFLSEYKLFGYEQLVKDIVERRDLHHRRTEMPEVFTWRRSDDPELPEYLLKHPENFPTFFEDYFKQLGKTL